jgi:uncharacterized damage-inducible protein DinB
MISRGYCVVMARYSAWQNSQLREILQAMDEVDVTRNRGAFFGSILGTLNHLMWGDAIWTARFDGGVSFDVEVEESVTLFASLAEWAPARAEMDARISRWAEGMSDAALQGVLRYYSGIMGAELSKPMAVCVIQLFNHQTHHRGQVHAMLTAAGARAPVSDLPFMPGDGLGASGGDI